MIDLVQNIYMTGREDVRTLTSCLTSGRNTDGLTGSKKVSAAASRIFASLGMVYAGYHASKVVYNIAASLISIALSAVTAASVGLLSYNAFNILKKDESKNFKIVVLESAYETQACFSATFKKFVGKFTPPAAESIPQTTDATSPT